MTLTLVRRWEKCDWARRSRRSGLRAGPRLPWTWAIAQPHFARPANWRMIYSVAGYGRKLIMSVFVIQYFHEQQQQHGRPAQPTCSGACGNWGREEWTRRHKKQRETRALGFLERKVLLRHIVNLHDNVEWSTLIYLIESEQLLVYFLFEESFYYKNESSS